MKKIYVLFIILSLPFSAFAEKYLFVFEDYPPYEYRENGRIIGADVDIIRAACERLGIEPEFSELPWKRAIYEVEVGTADAIFSLMHTQERAVFLEYPAEHLNVEKNVVFVRADSELDVKRLDDLKGLKVGVRVDYSYGPEFDAYTDIHKIASKNNTLLLRQLDAGRTDVAVLSRAVFEHFSKELGLRERFKILDYATSNDPLYVAFSKKAFGEQSKTFAESFSQALTELKAEGVVQEIIERYE